MVPVPQLFWSDRTNFTCGREANKMLQMGSILKKVESTTTAQLESVGTS